MVTSCGSRPIIARSTVNFVAEQQFNNTRDRLSNVGPIESQTGQVTWLSITWDM